MMHQPINHGSAAILLFLGLIMAAALTITMLKRWQNRSRGIRSNGILSHSSLLHRQHAKTISQRRSWHHLWQRSKQRDVEQAHSYPSLPQQHDGYGTINPQTNSSGLRALYQPSSSSFVSTVFSSCSSMLTSFTPAIAAADPQLTVEYSFSHTYKHIQTLTYCSEGPVHVVEHRGDGKWYVIKQVAAKNGLPHEAAILQEIQKHPNLIEVVDTLQGYTGNRSTSDIVTPFAELGDLHLVIDRFHKMNEYAPRAFILHFVSSMIDALAYLHNGDICYDARTGKVTSIGHRQPSIIHRDIKPLNIFLTADSTTPGLPQMKLADFGLACTADHNFGVVGTECYQAPEITTIVDLCRSGHSYYLDNQHHLRNICTKAGDMYAFGVSLFQLIFACGFDPRIDIDSEICFTYVEHDMDIRDLLKACLARDPADRPSPSSLHALSAKIKTELDTWYANGGRLPANMWPDPLGDDDARRAEEQSRLGEGATATSAFSIGEYF